jgi:hypothetical protein
MGKHEKKQSPHVSYKGMKKKKRSPRSPYISYALLWCEHEKETLDRRQKPFLFFNPNVK